MNKILVAYTTNSGLTEEVAQAIGEELGKSGCQVDVRRLEEVTGVENYQAVVVGAPMILGWHREALKFVQKHQRALAQLRVAYFITAMSLTQTGEETIGGIPVFIDPELAKQPQKANRLSLKERYARPANYLDPVLKAAPTVRPVSVAFFGGKLELFRLKLLQMLFVMVIIQAQPGDRRDWTLIRQWAFNLVPELTK